MATWNVNGLRARQGQLLAWLAASRPDIVCLQEIKASPDQLPSELRDIDGYWSGWHGAPGYSGVGLLVARASAPDAPVFEPPPFDFEQRILAADVSTPDGPVTVASVYVPNGARNYAAKLGFLEALARWAAERIEAGRLLVIAGDLNVARSDLDVHPKERRPNQIGTRPDERALVERLLAGGLVDAVRARHPDNPNLFTWWAPWRGRRERNIGWRIDYILPSRALYKRLVDVKVQPDIGTSDHAPVVATFAA